MAWMIGQYEILGELGRGAMAVVWRARDTRSGSVVAIKQPVVLQGARADTAHELAARFVREGTATLALRHPGIVETYAADMIDGQPVMVMELIDGTTMCEVIDSRRRNAAQTLKWIDELLDAVGYAHARGVVHRDIKPDNVFVTRDGHVKLGDFGIAQVRGGARITQFGSVLGTPGYMSPEQVKGLPADERSDIFAIGALGWELLSGYSPFGALDGLPGSTISHRVVSEPAPDIGSIVRGLPPHVARAIHKALEKQPSQRFQSADAMRDALRGETERTGAIEQTPNEPPIPPKLIESPHKLRDLDSNQPSRSTGKVLIYVAGALVVGLVLLALSAGVGSGGSGGGSGVIPVPEGVSQPQLGISASTEAVGYATVRAIDGDLSTAWSPAPDEPNAWLELDLGAPTEVLAIELVSAPQATTSGVAQQEVRPSRVRIEFSNGESDTVSLADSSEPQTFNPTTALQTSRVRVYIEDTYPSSNGTNGAVVISELVVRGTPSDE